MSASWRDLQEWTKCGLPQTTASDEACKMLDAAITQVVGKYADPNLGGVVKTTEKIIQADPTFVMGHVLKNGLEIMGSGSTVYSNNDIGRNIYTMAALADQQTTLTTREKKHVAALKLYAQGQKSSACEIWEDILLDHPMDMLALKYAYFTYFNLGYQQQLRDTVARVMPRWKPSTPLYGYLFGMHAFGLEETNLYDVAEKTARKGLELIPSDIWATHAVAHVMEMQGRQTEGIKFMSDTVKDWVHCDTFASHTFWHWALYHVEMGNYEEAIGLFDSEISPRYHSGGLLALVDATSLLSRLQLEGVSIGDRWEDLFQSCSSHFDGGHMPFTQIHLLLSCLGNKRTESKDKMLDSIRHFVRNGQGTDHQVMKDVGATICEALVAYDEGDFSRTVELMSPIRYQIYRLGNSNAQRDLFHQFLIHAALQSPSKSHQNLARVLLIERKNLKNSSPLTDRLLDQSMHVHDH